MPTYTHMHTLGIEHGTLQSHLVVWEGEDVCRLIHLPVRSVEVLNLPPSDADQAHVKPSRTSCAQQELAHTL